MRRITALKSKEEEIKTLESEVVKESDKTKSEQAQLLNDIEVLKKGNFCLLIVMLIGCKSFNPSANTGLQTNMSI